MSRSPRAEALHLVQTGEPLPPPPVPPADIEKDSPEATEFLASVKEAHYAGLAQTIDLLFERTLDMRDSTAPYGLSQKESPDYTSIGGWRYLANDFHRSFLVGMKDLPSTEIYKQTEKYTQLIGRLDSKRWLDLHFQLDGGAGTGVTSVLTLLRNGPRIVRHHEPDASLEEVGAIFRNPASLILLRRLAKMSVNQLMAAQSTLTNDPLDGRWSNEKMDAVLDPSHFQVQKDASGNHSLAYADFEALEVPPGFTLRHTNEPFETATPVKDIPGHQPKTIGCPVTLLQGRLAELMDWGLDIVEGEGLWENGWVIAESGLVKPGLSRQS